LIDWHKTYVHPNHIILGISGDFDSAAMEAKLRAAFESWPKGPELPKTKSSFSRRQAGYYLIPKEDVNQSSIHMVALGTTRNNPDYYAISVFNEAFGGGFSSRLFNDIRTKRGLAYNVGGGIGTNFGHPGILQFVAGPKAKARSSLSRRSTKTSTMSPRIPSPTMRSSTPKTRSSTHSSSASTRPTKFSPSA
jgi:zinc protease